MQVKVEKQPKATLKLVVTVPSEKVKEEYELAFENVVKNTEVPGFRKGMAPKEMVKEKTDVSKLYGDVINTLLQKYYSQALKENLIIPVSNPKVEIKEFDLEKDFEFTATLAVKPDVEVGEYKQEIRAGYEKKLEEAGKQKEGLRPTASAEPMLPGLRPTASAEPMLPGLRPTASAEPMLPGLRPTASAEPMSDSHVHLHTNDIVEVLLKNSKVDVSDLLVDEETERMMSRLIDQAQSIGLSLDQYLKAQNKTADQLRTEYKKVAENNLKAEFILEKLIKEEKVEVLDKEVEDAINASGIPDAAEKLNNPVEKWYIKSILEKNKLISKLMEEAEGENYHAH